MSCSRRDFLRLSLGAAPLVSLGAGPPSFLCRAALAAEPKAQQGETVLVVVQLSGGNDGLNTVAPVADDAYRRHRPTIALPADKVHKIDSYLGFHPRMPGFARLYREGLMCVVQGVGYENPDDNHAVAMHHWQTGRPHDNACQTGWLGRALDRARQADDLHVPALFVSLSSHPLALTGDRVLVPSLRSLDQWVFRDMPGAAGRGYRSYVEKLAGAQRTVSAAPLLETVCRGSREALRAARRVEEIVQADQGSGGYPDFRIAQMLRAIARLIRADLGIRIFFTELGGDGFGGFDTHANQLGNHCALLEQLSESVAAFADDLRRDRLLDRVLLMTFSEFGRTLQENGRHGTGHGAAAPMFLVGARLRGGLAGAHPSLTALESNGGLKFHTDFRRVYATALSSWLGFDSRPVLGDGFAPLDVLNV